VDYLRRRPVALRQPLSLALPNRLHRAQVHRSLWLTVAITLLAEEHIRQKREMDWNDVVNAIRLFQDQIAALNERLNELKRNLDTLELILERKQFAKPDEPPKPIR
jgi:hypothetical protein